MKTTRYVGQCQICEGDQKLQQGRMVHHGYRRPGDGEIHGDCPGVYAVPYEVSCDLVKVYKTDRERELPRLEARLADIESGRVVKFSKFDTWNRCVKDYDKDTTPPREFARALEHLQWDAERNVRDCQSEIKRSEGRIAAWTPKPVRTVEEEQKKADTAQAERKAIRVAARAARDAKRVATRAKQEALEARRKTVREDFEVEFRALAAGSDSLADRQAAAQKLLGELEKTKYRSWLSRWDLRCEDAFVELRLAVQTGINGHGRPYLKWNV